MILNRQPGEQADPPHSGVVALGHVTDYGYPVVTVAMDPSLQSWEWCLVSGLPVENPSSPCFHSFPNQGHAETTHTHQEYPRTRFSQGPPFPPFAVFGHPLFSALLGPILPPANFPAMIRLRELRDLISHPDSSLRVDNRPR